MFAQGNATLNGTVTDSTAAVISSAVVTATNDTTGMATTRVTNESGNYEFTNLLPGFYTLTAEVPSFETGIFRNVELRADQPVLLSFTLELGTVDTVVVVGTRARPRSVTESTVPIDAINMQELGSQGVTDLGEQLRTLVPSFNVNIQPISDASTIVRPMMLRNLAPDHILLLVNGRRRHRSSIIDWHGGNGVAFGSQGPDISVIPSIALRQVEVLRDGAAAQYGSDAIAGVINLLPKDNRSGGSLEFTTGAFGQGWDGKAYTLAGNVGLPLGKTGFANLSLEYGSSNPTDRSIQRSDVADLIAAGNDNVRNPAQVWGSPEIDDNLKLFVNFGYLFGNGLQFYGHTNYANKKVNGGFFFRNPNTRGGVFSADGGRTLLIGDVLAARNKGSANCPTVTITNHVPDPDALGQVIADPNCFSFQERFPGGFTPNFGGDATDSSAVAGLRGFTTGGVVWDASISVGAHETGLFIINTVNASLGPNTPTDFHLGSNRQQEMSLNFDVSYAVSDRLNIAGGAEWRNEQYETRLGQRESWDIGPYAAQGFSVGSNGFSDFSPLAAGTWNRSSIATYGDVELSGLEDRWTIGAAARVEKPGSGNQQTILDFAHFANGTGISSEMVFLNPSTQPSRPAVYFYDTEGNPIAADSVVDMTGDLEITEDGALTVQTEMEPLGELTISTHGRGELVTGSVRVVSDGPIGGLLRFEHPGVGAGVVGASPPVSDALFPVRRQEGGITTWAAIHNLELSPGLLRCDLMREGVLLDAVSIPLEANGQTSWFIDQAFPAADTSDFAGSVRCDAVGEGLFSAVALEMDPGNRIFTTLSVVPVPEMPDRE